VDIIQFILSVIRINVFIFEHTNFTHVPNSKILIFYKIINYIYFFINFNEYSINIDLYLVLRQGNFRQNFPRKFPKTFGTKV